MVQDKIEIEKRLVEKEREYRTNSPVTAGAHPFLGHLRLYQKQL